MDTYLISMRLLRKLDCIETLSGALLIWEPLDNVFIDTVVVYGINHDREYVIDTPLAPTGRCFVDKENMGLADSYKLEVKTVEGFKEVTPPVQPTTITKASQILLREIRRRERRIMKSNPFGAYAYTILLKKQFGEECPTCGRGRCAGYGCTAPSTGCPNCLGTGMLNPYLVYPKREYMLPMSPKEDAKTNPPGVERLATTRQIRTVFDGIIREDDMLVVGNEAYIVNQQQVAASVGNTPAVYILQAVQVLPEDERYPKIIELCEDVR